MTDTGRTAMWGQKLSRGMWHKPGPLIATRNGKRQEASYPVPLEEAQPSLHFTLILN